MHEFLWNRSFSFEVMIKKSISDEKFRISLRQWWWWYDDDNHGKIVGTPYAIYYNYLRITTKNRKWDVTLLNTKQRFLLLSSGTEYFVFRAGLTLENVKFAVIFKAN